MKKRIGLALTLLLAVGVIVLLAAVGWVLEIAATAPDIKTLKPIDKGAVSVVYAADGSRLGYVQSDTVRLPIVWTKMPLVAREATVAIEDRRFYRHGAIDLPGIARAAFKNILSGHTIQGGSTITQQLVRQLYIQNPKRDTLIALCRFFRVSPTYFFPELDGLDTPDGAALAQADLINALMATINLPPEAKRQLAAFLRTLQPEQLDENLECSVEAVEAE